MPLARATVFGENGVDLVPGRAVDDRLVLARMRCSFVHRLAEVDAVIEELVDRALVDQLARPLSAVLGDPGFRGVTGATELMAQLRRRAEAQETAEDQPHQLSLAFVHHQLAVDDVIAERRNTAHPHALATGGRELVANTLTDDLALELGKRQENVERQPAHRCRRVELLCYADERSFILFKYFNNSCEVSKRAAQPVHLVDDDHVDATALDIAQQPLQRRPLHAAAGKSAVVVAVADEDPALVLLGFVCRPAPPPGVGVERVELHVEALVGRDAGVDGAANFANGRFHVPLPFRRPKNAGPFQRVPVIARAIAESDLYRRP